MLLLMTSSAIVFAGTDGWKRRRVAAEARLCFSDTSVGPYRKDLVSGPVAFSEDRYETDVHVSRQGCHWGAERLRSIQWFGREREPSFRCRWTGPLKRLRLQSSLSMAPQQGDSKEVAEWFA